MCEICSMSKEDREKAYHYRAEQLRRFAVNLYQLGNGAVQPHSPETRNMAESAKSLIKFLVEDWL